VLTPHLRGREFEHLSYATSLCGACTTVCPVKIDLHHHLLHNRRDFMKAGHGKASERFQFRLWRAAMLNPKLYAMGGWLTRKGLRAIYGLGLSGSLLDPLRAWNRKRATLPVARQSFREQWRNGLGNSR
jgi:L-lactate dehydrogenase complex protein LldF